MKREVERKMRMVGLLCGVAVASMAGVFDFETGRSSKGRSESR